MFGEAEDQDSDIATAMVTTHMKMTPFWIRTAPTFLGFEVHPGSPRDGFGDAEGHPHTMLVPLQKDGMEAPGQDFQWEFPG